jgi:RES domain
MSFSSKNAFREFDRSVRRAYRFARTPAQTDFLNVLAQSSVGRVKKLNEGAHLYRAQLGHGWRKEEVSPGEFEEFPSALGEARMVPDPNLVGDGRVNAKGIACLYLSTKEETAALEVRPLIGSHVSIGVFRIMRDLRIVDCSEKLIGNLARYTKDAWTEEEIELQVWTDINNAFSAPVERSDAGLTYVPTQIIAETFRLQGYDGIAYKSGYGEDGYNVALFDVAVAKLKMCGLHRVDKMTVKLGMADNPYYVTEEGAARNKIVAVYPVAPEEPLSIKDVG